MAGIGAVRGVRQPSNCGPRARLDSETTKVRATANLPLELSEKLHRVTAATGMTMSAYISTLVARDAVDESGRPLWAFDQADAA